jgi:hypothetical protein
LFGYSVNLYTLVCGIKTRCMIYLANSVYVLCSILAIHPTVFVSDGECIAVCDAHSDSPHECYIDGKSTTDCFSDNGESQLCDAYIHMITTDDYEVIP